MRLPEIPSIILNHLSFIYRNKTVTNTQTYLSDGWGHSASRNITTRRVYLITCFNFIKEVLIGTPWGGGNKNLLAPPQIIF